MTIKEFAALCNCNPQTLRYYHRIDLLKPARVDEWTGYRYYDKEQAIDFIKIKHFQDAEFSIEEIKEMLAQSEEEIYDAFERKIREQEQRLLRIEEIQQSYISEKKRMSDYISNMKEYLTNQLAQEKPEAVYSLGMLAAVVKRNEKREPLRLGCTVKRSEDGENYFYLRVEKE